MKLYRITMNWHGEILTYFRNSKNKERALYFGITALAKVVGYSRYYVSKHIMSNDADRWVVTPMVK